MKRKELRLLYLHDFKLGNDANQTTAKAIRHEEKAQQVKEQYENGFKNFVVVMKA